MEQQRRNAMAGPHGNANHGPACSQKRQGRRFHRHCEGGSSVEPPSVSETNPPTLLVCATSEASDSQSVLSTGSVGRWPWVRVSHTELCWVDAAVENAPWPAIGTPRTAHVGTGVDAEETFTPWRREPSPPRPKMFPLGRSCAEPPTVWNGFSYGTNVYRSLESQASSEVFRVRA